MKGDFIMANSAYMPKHIEVTSKEVLDEQAISYGSIYICKDSGDMYYDSPSSGSRIKVAPSQVFTVPDAATGNYGSNHTVTSDYIKSTSVCYFIPDPGMRDLYNDTGISITAYDGYAVVSNSNNSDGKYNVYGSLCVIN